MTSVTHLLITKYILKLTAVCGFYIYIYIYIYNILLIYLYVFNTEVYYKLLRWSYLYGDYSFLTIFLINFVLFYATVVFSSLNDGSNSIEFSREKTLEILVEFRRHQPRRFGKSNYSKDSRIHKQSFDLITIWIKIKIYILFRKTKYYVTITNKIIVTNLISQTLPKCDISYLNK